jgi:AcrR family transcriptional regulator
MAHDPVAAAVPATPKGRRGRERLLDSATVVLAREGFGGASIARITEQAGVPKRMVLYYFGTREALLAEVVRRIGDQIAANARAHTPAAAEPHQAAAAWLEALWRGATADPQIARAYFALIGGSWGDAIGAALEAMRRTFLDLADDLVATCARAGWSLREEREVFQLFAFSLVRGLLLEWVDAGETPALAQARAQVAHSLAAAFAEA